VAVALELGQAGKVTKLLQNEPDVTKRRDIIGHVFRVSPGKAAGAARPCPGPARWPGNDNAP
jgi:hypothetical protein